IRGLRTEPEEGARLHRARRRQAADGLRLPPADDLLPAHRPGGVDGRADGDGGEGNARCLLRRDARHRPRGGGGAGAVEGGAAPPAREAARRGAGGEEPGRQVRLRGALAARGRAGAGVDPGAERRLTCGAAASCPQAASMSRPRVRRTVTGTRARSSSCWNAAIRSREEPWYRPVGLYGMRLTLKWSRPSSPARARACSGASFTPASITYSTKTRRRVASACRWHSATTSAIGYRSLTGMILERSSSSAAWSESARRIGSSTSS